MNEAVTLKKKNSSLWGIENYFPDGKNPRNVSFLYDTIKILISERNSLK